MLTELVKWLQGLGAGLVFTLVEYVQHVPTTSWWQIAFMAALVRLLGFLVAKLPVPAK